ncbi:hypothetical protein, partial [Anoxynatronum sibiricum]
TPSVTGSWQVGVRGRMPGSTQWVDHIRDHQVSSASITSVQVSVDQGSSSTVNQAITLRASSNPPGAEFEFWVRPPGQ